MNRNVEGSFTLDGLIEGPLAGQADSFRSRLNAWVDSARSAGLEFSLDVAGDAFSILGRSKPLRASDLGDNPAQRVAALLFDLLKLFPPDQRRRLFSTLRSTEVRPNEEVQTIYAVTPDGSVDMHQRTVGASTEAPSPPLTTRQKVRIGLLGLLVALAIFGVSSFFVDYGQVFRWVRNTVVPLDPDKVKVETTTLAPYLTIEKRSVAADSAGRRVLVLAVKRTKDFPRTDADLAKALADPKIDLRGRLTIEALARGYVRFECFDSDGTVLAYGDLRVAPLRDKETVELSVPIPTDRRLARLRLAF